MPDYRFRIVNVFAESTFGGDPLCVFEDGRGLSDAQMLALARQFNLSETTFILPAEQADANVRIFTPGYEMRFAGHPTLGTAHVIRASGKLRRRLTTAGSVWTMSPIAPRRTTKIRFGGVMQEAFRCAPERAAGDRRTKPHRALADR